MNNKLSEINNLFYTGKFPSSNGLLRKLFGFALHQFCFFSVDNWFRFWILNCLIAISPQMTVQILHLLDSCCSCNTVRQKRHKHSFILQGFLKRLSQKTVTVKNVFWISCVFVYNNFVWLVVTGLEFVSWN